jgi:carbonic anhydrase
MSKREEILAHNKRFVANKEYEQFKTDKFPDKKMVIVTCMDTRLVELLPHALNLRNGDAKIIKCAGAMVAHRFGSIMRSILVAIYKLQAEEVFVIGHYDCGMTGLHLGSFVDEIRANGITEDVFQQLQSEINMEKWLCGFDSPQTSVKESVELVRNHPLMPKHVLVHGLIIDPETGRLDEVVNGDV